MKNWLMVLVVVGGCFCVLAYFFSGLSDYSRGYWFVWPYIVLSVTCFAAAIIGLTRPNARRIAFWLAVTACMLIPFSALWALRLWPGGDDGPGMAWLTFVLPVTGVAGFLALAAALQVSIVRLRNRDKIERGAA